MADPSTIVERRRGPLGMPRWAMVAWGVAAVVVVLWAGAWAVAWATQGTARSTPIPNAQLPVLYDMPMFSLTASDGTIVSDADLRGGRVIVEFIFTECRLFCPVMSIRMGELQAALAQDPSMSDVRLVSISVDPDNDTPDVLAAYAQRYDADPRRWTFLTGPDRATVWRLVEEGFKLPVTDESENAAMPIGHSGKWLVFDRHGQARATVTATQGPTVEQALEALRAVDAP
ncbi:MAG: SCO family protein [Planctomycetota bacterium]